MYIVPPILVVLVNHPAPNKYDLRSLRFVFSGAAPLGLGLIKKVKDKFIERGNKTVGIIQGCVLSLSLGVCDSLF